MTCDFCDHRQANEVKLSERNTKFAEYLEARQLRRPLLSLRRIPSLGILRSPQNRRKRKRRRRSQAGGSGRRRRGRRSITRHKAVWAS